MNSAKVNKPIVSLKIDAELPRMQNICCCINSEKSTIERYFGSEFVEVVCIAISRSITQMHWWKVFVGTIKTAHLMITPNV